MRHALLRAALAAAFVVPALSIAAEPASGTLTAANDEAHPLTYTADGGDPFALTIDLPADYGRKHPHTYIRLLFPNAANDASESVDADTGTPDPLDPTAHWANSHVFGEGVDQILMVASGGIRNTIVNSGTASGAVTIALVDIPDDPGNPSLPYAAQGSGPRFAVYRPKDFPGLGLDYAEPSIGLDPRNGDVFSINTLDVLRTRFDDSTTPARHTWESKRAFESTLVSLDPILAADPGTGRIFSLNLSGPISTADYSDDGGESWLPGGNGFPSSGVDHQTLGAGPYPSTGLGALIPHPLYPNAVYYCSQGIADAYCSRSDDGGVTFLPSVILYTAIQCTGLHGHVKVGPDGTVYVPNKACGIDSPIFGNGSPGLIVSEDAGLTWTVRELGTDVTSALNTNDPSVAIGKDNTVYYAYHSMDGALKVAVSQDHGATWFNVFDVGAIAGVRSAKFPAVVAGDAGRAAVAFVGTRFPALPRSHSGSGVLAIADFPDEDIDFPGVYRAYIASTFDYGAHWFVSEVAPDDILQGPKGIGGSGDNRNLLDFNDATIDTEGRILATFADGCVGACGAGIQGTSISAMRVAEIVRQTGGPRMYANFDPLEPAAPPPPRLTGYRTRDYVVLRIDADHGGSPITGYDLRRDGVIIAQDYRATTFVDAAANDASKSYHYTATARNALGESAEGNPFTPAVDENAPVTSAVCAMPGQVHADQVNEPGAELPPIDVVSLAIAEPEDQPGKLVFTVTMRAPLGYAAIAFDHPNGRRYTIEIDATGTTASYTDGRWYSNTQSQLANVLAPVSDVPPLDSSGADAGGHMTAVLDKEAWGLATGDELKNVRVLGEVITGVGQVFLRDFLGYDLTVPIVGNDFCAKGAHLPPPVVDAGPVTPPPATGTAGGEKRFGGALGLGLLIALAGAAIRRRASRAA